MTNDPVQLDEPLLEVLKRYASHGYISDAESILDELRADTAAQPGDLTIRERFVEGLCFVLKSSRHEVFKGNHEILLEELRQLAKRYPDDHRIQDSLADALQDLVYVFPDDDAYIAGVELTIERQDSALGELCAFVRENEHRSELQSVYCESLLLALEFSSGANQLERCSDLLRNLSSIADTAQRDSDAQQFVAKGIAVLIEKHVDAQNVAEMFALIAQLRTMSSDNKGNTEVQEVCTDALLYVLQRESDQLSVEYCDLLLEDLRRLTKTRTDYPNEWDSRLLAGLKGADVKDLTTMSKRLGLGHRLGLVPRDDVSLEKWWYPCRNDQTRPDAPKTAFDLLMGLIVAYMLHNSGYSKTVNTILGVLIMLSIENAIETISLSSSAIALIDHFLKETTLDWDWELISTRSFTYGVADHFAQNTDDGCLARKRLSADLGLTFPTVDWCGLNATKSRIADLISYYETKKSTLNDTAAQHLVDLTVASISRALEEGVFADLSAAESFVTTTAWTYEVRLAPTIKDFREVWGKENPRKKISHELNLHFPALDWLKSNASSEILPQFISLYVKGREAVRSSEWYLWLGELILHSLSLVKDRNQISLATEPLIYSFFEAQRGELAASLAQWFPRAPKPILEIVVRHMHSLGAASSGDQLSVGFGCEVNGYCQGYIVEYVLNCLFGFPLWIGNQDWGYCNRDARRLLEFLTFYLSLSDPEPVVEGPVHALLCDLIVHSLERAIEKDLLDSATENAVAAFARSYYWRNRGYKVFVKQFVYTYMKNVSAESEEADGNIA